MQELIGIAEQIAIHLVVRKQTISVAESSTGRLIPASLLAVSGASAYFLGSAVVYTREARRILMDIPDVEMKGIRSVSETYANCWLTRSAAASRRTGACRKPARPTRSAIAMATLPAIAASALPGPSLR